MAHPVIPQVSPEKQAMLRSVLAQRPVARIRAVRPESIAESRLLSNLTGLMHAEEKKDHSETSISMSQSQAPSKSGLFALEPVTHSLSPDIKPQLPREGLVSSESTNATTRAIKQVTTPVVASRQTTEVEDITPPSSPLNLDQKAKAIGNQQMISSLSLQTRFSATVAPGTNPAISFTDTKPKVSALPSYSTVSKPDASIQESTSVPSFSVSKSDSLIGMGSSSLFGKSSFASAFSTGTSTPTTTAASSKPTTAVTESFASFGMPTVRSTASVAATTKSQNNLVPPAPAPFFSTATPTSSLAPVSIGTSIVGKPVEAVPSLKTNFSFTSLSSTSTAPNPALASSVVPVPLTSVTPSVTPSPSNLFFTSTTLPASTSVPTAVTAAPFSFVLPQSSTAINSPTTTSVSQSSTIKPKATLENFSFSLTKSTTTASTPTAAPFTFDLSGNSGIPSNAVSTKSVFGGTTTSTATGAVFSSIQPNKAPTAFGVVATTTAVTISTPSAPLFGQVPAASTIATTAPAVTSLFGQSASVQSTTTPNTGLTSLFGQSKLGDVVTAPSGIQTTLTQGTTSTAAVQNTVPATTVTAPLFGRPTTTTGSTGTSLFGQPTNATTTPFGSAFGQTVFGQPVSAAITPTPTAAPVFGQSTFGKPSHATPQSTVTPAPVFGSAPVFGQPTGTPSGVLAGNVFGQSAASATTAAKPLFGGSAFGQNPTSISTVAASPATSPAPSTAFGSNLFGNMGLGGTPSVANANRNAFGGGAVFGSATPSGKSKFTSTFWCHLTMNSLGTGTFGATSVTTPFGSLPAASVVSPPTFGSPSSTGFGAFGQSQPAFGGAATFGGSPLFGNKPTFGGGATFGSPPVASIATAKPETGIFWYYGNVLQLL